MVEMRTTTGGGDDQPQSPWSSEIAAAFARERAARATGEVNTSASWQVRIDWHCEPPVVWPPFTTDHRPTVEEATGIALAALRWIPDPVLHVTGAAVRGPGEAAWQPVHLPQAVAAC